MSAPTLESIETTVSQFFIDEVLEGESEDLTSETPLLEYGLLDSLTLAKLVASLEQTYGVVLPTEQLGPQNLQTIHHIAKLVATAPQAG